jgi:hypothetical protein
LFSFRYHAISLVAVFLALAIGVLLGVSIGEGGVVSGARKSLENSLRGDLNNERSKVADARHELGIRDSFERQAYPGLVTALLAGFRVGVLAIGKLPSGYAEAIREAVEPAGAQIDSISVVRAPLPLSRIAGQVQSPSLSRLNRDPDALARFGRRLGRQLVNGGVLVQRVQRQLFSSSRGAYRGLDGIVWVRDRDGLTGADKVAEDTFESSLLEGLKATGGEIVGVEMRNTDPSQVPFFASHKLPSVDDLDLVAGRTALVYALLGAEGQFGIKRSADQLLPPPPVERTTPRQ